MFGEDSEIRGAEERNMLANASDASRLSSQEALPVSFTGTHLNIDFFSYATDLASSKSSFIHPSKSLRK